MKRSNDYAERRPYRYIASLLDTQPIAHGRALPLLDTHESNKDGCPIPLVPLLLMER